MVRFFKVLFVFFLGFGIGTFIARLVTKEESTSDPGSNSLVPNYSFWFNKQALFRKSEPWDSIRYKKRYVNQPVIESDFLFQKVSILCVILLKNKKYAKPIKETWAKGCNEITFVDIHKNKSISIKRNIKDSSWLALCETLQYVGNHAWILIVSDLTFVIMENLRYFLAPRCPLDKYYFGHTEKFWNSHYNSKEGGIVISRATLNTFREKIKLEDCLSSSYWNKEDFYLGKILSSLNITPADSSDSDGFALFYPHNLNTIIFYEGDQYKSSKIPIKCCSNHTVSFHAVDGDKMYTYYYLLYSLQIFNEGIIGNIPNSQENDDKIWKKFLKQRNVSTDNISSIQYYQIWEDFFNDSTSFAKKMKRENVGDEL